MKFKISLGRFKGILYKDIEIVIIEKTAYKIGDTMKFFWQLDNKGKFIRALWMGLFALLFLYVVVWYYSANITIPIVLTVLYIADLGLRYKKIKRSKGYC